MENCGPCKVISIMLGKKFMMPFLGHRYSKLLLQDAEKHLGDLDLSIVGGLAKRGWTMNDVDVIGKRAHVALLSERLHASGISNPIHWCGSRDKHSHIQCAYFGVKLAITGKGH